MEKVLPLEHDLKASLAAFRRELQRFLTGKEAMADTVVASLISGGHVLLEDVPGVGKTTFIKALAQYLGLAMKRVQFTSDLLPSDIIGAQIYDQEEKVFTFHEGPIFTNILLADELNRASPKTQSALLEAMGERAVTVDRKTRKLPAPFFVVAAQNPSDHMGTFPIPESQLDRFAIKIKLDYPSAEKELQIFSQALLNPLSQIEEGILMKDQLVRIQIAVDQIHVSNEVGKCVQAVVDRSRDHSQIQLGISTRGGVQWVRLAKGIALLEGREYVTPDDLIAVAEHCLMHRMIFHNGQTELVLQDLLQSMDI
ncbi:AAA family ATPase [Pseudobacteriovorax antillogorgiicola]|uniref:MoxR-like ATPase n=1 Tax=Pseudobacteriovorax antillogorgiicola TaxID=1513793 RepID=A0A1Y6BF31_9BACT|nr:MoxR family ATPase [Pseudobacteriovorax antillogorgiicola]TCS56277.1 MoxR-like ATPase [Pseudobacteriovorax antillogorgiicola]SMF07702.1 MoxR-like ATPase [Pseudobacteriovorax antillogorgiicola]